MKIVPTLSYLLHNISTQIYGDLPVAVQPLIFRTIPRQNVFNFVCNYKVTANFSGDDLGQTLSSYFKVNMNNFAHRQKVLCVWKPTSEGSMNSVKFHLLPSVFIVVL